MAERPAHSPYFQVFKIWSGEGGLLTTVISVHSLDFPHPPVTQVRCGAIFIKEADISKVLCFAACLIGFLQHNAARFEQSNLRSSQPHLRTLELVLLPHIIHSSWNHRASSDSSSKYLATQLSSIEFLEVCRCFLE